MVEEGQPAPEFELGSDSGEDVSLATLRGKMPARPPVQVEPQVSGELVGRSVVIADDVA